MYWEAREGSTFPSSVKENQEEQSMQEKGVTSTRFRDWGNRRGQQIASKPCESQKDRERPQASKVRKRNEIDSTLIKIKSGAHLNCQHSGGRSRQISVNSRPAWPTKGVPEQSGLHRETLCLKIQNKLNR